MDALDRWNAGVHACGHHESEQDDPETVFVAGYSVCRACEALQEAQKQQRVTDAPAIKAGENPDYPRWWRLRRTTRAEYRAEQAAKAKARAGKKTGEELLADIRKMVASSPIPQSRQERS